MGGKGKKGKKGGSGFKLAVKADDPAAQKEELQMKKKILEDKYIIQKTKTAEAIKRLEEARTRCIEVTKYKDNEDDKFKSIASDFIHQSALMEKNFKEKLQELGQQKEEKDKKKLELNKKLNDMKAEHDKKIQEKEAMFKEIKTQMEVLSSDFSRELSEIQKLLKKQTETVSEKWEKNPSEHIQTFAKEVEKYEVTSGEDKIKEPEP